MELKQKLKENWVLLSVLTAAIVIRLYFFFVTSTQPIWWDEAGYMAVAKSYTGIFSYPLESIRMPLYPLMMSVFFRFGAVSEPIMRFISLFLPSILLIILTYVCMRAMYSDKRVAIISTVLMSILCESLFYSNRFMTENPALIFELLAIIVLFKGYVKKEDWWIVKARHSLIWVAAFSIVALLFRPANIIFVPAIILFYIFLNRSRMFSIITAISLAVVSAAVFIFREKIPFVSSAMSMYYHPELPITFAPINVFYGFYQSMIPNIPSVLFYCFLIGIFLLIVNLFAKYDQKDLDIRADRFNLILILSTMAMFMILIRADSYELRWMFVLLPALFGFTAKGMIWISELVPKLRPFSAVIIIMILSIGAYSSCGYADALIQNKVGTYSQVKDSALWMKDNSIPGDVIISMSTPQTAYYSERETYNYQTDVQSLEQLIAEKNPKFVTFSAFEYHPEWIKEWLVANEGRLQVINVFFADQQMTQPILIVYRLR